METLFLMGVGVCLGFIWGCPYQMWYMEQKYNAKLPDATPAAWGIAVVLVVVFLVGAIIADG